MTVEKSKKPFISPRGVFIQERASKQLPGPGQHFSFGALQSWDAIHQMLEDNPGSKLLLVVRHGQAISNWLGDTLGPDEWFKVEETCAYTDSDNKTWGIFDADLTEMGQNEARSLNSMLYGGKWFSKMTADRPTRAIISPLSRCLQTATLVASGLPLTGMEVEENIRETLGEDTCDARRSMSNPDPQHPEELEGPCDFRDGLAKAYPMFKFQLVNETARQEDRKRSGKRATKAAADDDDGTGVGVVAQYGFGLTSDQDRLWTKDRETQKDQVKRATKFLHDVFEYVDERVALVVTHSGFTRSILLAVGREPYRPQNTELVPVIVKQASDGPFVSTTSQAL